MQVENQRLMQCAIYNRSQSPTRDALHVVNKPIKHSLISPESRDSRIQGSLLSWDSNVPIGKGPEQWGVRMFHHIVA